MLRCLWAIISNTFIEILRQNVYGIIIAVTILLLVFGPSLSMFTLDDDNQLLQDICLSTLLVAGLGLAVFAATSVITDEIERKTVLTIITKTVSRPVFIIGKFIGTASAVLLGMYLLSLVLLMVTRHGVLQRASDLRDMVVVTLGFWAVLLVFLVSLAGNYFYQWRFSSTAILLATLVATLLMAILVFIAPDWSFNPQQNNIHLWLIGPIILAMICSVIITAIAVAMATRLGLVATLILCTGLFILGAGVHYWLAPFATQTGIKAYLAWLGLAVLPSIDLYVVTNAVYQQKTLPMAYIAHTALYAFCYVLAALLFAIALFRKRQIS